MAIEMTFKFKKSENNSEKLLSSLQKFGIIYDKEYDQFIIKFRNKWIWIFLYEEVVNAPYIVVEFSSDFKKDEQDREYFIKEILSLGFELTNDEDFEDDEQEKSVIPLVLDVEKTPYKTYLGKNYTQEEWKKFEEEEYRKYVEKRSGKKSSFLADDKVEKENFSAESGTLKEVKYFVMNPRQDKVPVYEYPSTMVAPFTFLINGTAVEVLKYEKDGWCEILSQEKKKAYIHGSHVNKND